MISVFDKLSKLFLKQFWIIQYIDTIPVQIFSQTSFFFPGTSTSFLYFLSLRYQAVIVCPHIGF